MLYTYILSLAHTTFVRTHIGAILC